MHAHGNTAEIYAAAYARLGTFAAVAREFGVNESAVRRSLNNARKKADPAIQAAMASVGTGMRPALAWAKTKPGDDGIAYSVLLKPENTPDDFLERIRDAFDGMAPAPQVPAPAYADADLLTAYTIADWHAGMLAWGKETGKDYDLNIARHRLVSWMGSCIASAPASETAVILGLGDMLHADDSTNQTPRSKHALDTDTRHFRTMETAIEALASAVEMAAAKHRRVIVRLLPGNHDPNAYLAVMFALAERFRTHDRVTVYKVPGEHFVHEHGRVMLAAHHGDKAKAQQLVLFLADEHAEVWGRTRHRYLFTGHLHHHKSQDIGGVQWEQLRAVASRDAYAVGHAYCARAQMQAITYHRERGEIHRVKVGA